ncbi:MAG: RdgB/HAM1 family non-canonical purine NTP pyrophosphatase [Trueperaceae bacterium]
MKRCLVLATRNAGKIAELRLALAHLDLELASAVELGLGEGPVEHGHTYEENALIKAAHAAHATGIPALSDDSGLEVDALAGAPGIYSSRFGGALSDGERIAHLLQKLRNVPEEARGAAFVSVLVLARPTGQVKSFNGVCRGRILLGPRGEGGHGYDPIFWSSDLHKTFAEVSAKEKESVSHRGRAVAGFASWAAQNPCWFSSRAVEAPG